MAKSGIYRGSPLGPECQSVDVSNGSKGEILDASRCFPLFTQQRTSLNGVGMSVRCQGRTSPKGSPRASLTFSGNHLKGDAYADVYGRLCLRRSSI